MRIVERAKRTERMRAVKGGGMACAGILWMLVAMPLPAQNGLAQNGATQEGMAQNGATQADGSGDSGEVIGVSRPDPSIITVTPYADGAPGNSPGNTPMAQPAAVSAMAPVKTGAKTGASLDTGDGSYTATGVVISTRGGLDASTGEQDATGAGQGATADGQDATGGATFDPDASIVTAQTAGRADRQLLAGTEDAATMGDPDAGIVTHVPSLPGEVPDGTLVKVKLREALSTLTTRRGTVFTAELSAPVMHDGQVVVPAGSLLEGRVTEVRGGKRVGGAAAIHLEPERIILPDGSQYALHAQVIDTDSWDDTRINNEGTILRKDHAKGTTEAIGLSAGGAMAAGAMIGGVPGALIGAGVGAGVGAVVWMRQDYQADLPKDLGVVFSLTEPMRIEPLSARLARPGVGNAGGE